MIKTSPFNAEGAGLISGRGAKIPHGLMAKKNQNTKQKQYCNTFNKDLKKNGPHQKTLQSDPHDHSAVHGFVSKFFSL